MVSHCCSKQYSFDVMRVLIEPLLHMLSFSVNVLPVASHREFGKRNITKSIRSNASNLTFRTSEWMKNIPVEIKSNEYPDSTFLYF